jgi:hypothetical protein
MIDKKLGRKMPMFIFAGILATGYWFFNQLLSPGFRRGSFVLPVVNSIFLKLVHAERYFGF